MPVLGTYVDVVPSDLLAAVAGQLGGGSAVFPRPGGVSYLGPATDQDVDVGVLDVPSGDAQEWVAAYQVAASPRAQIAPVRDRIVLKDDPASVRRVVALHERLIAARRQFAVDVLFVELSFNATYALGINWDLGGSAGLRASPAGVTFPYDFEVIAEFAAKESSSVARIVTEQRLHVVEGDSASLQVGDSVPVPQRVTSPEGVVRTSGFDVVDTGVLLEVQCRAADRGRVQLQLDPEVSQVTRFVEQYPVISRRRFTSSCVLEPGGMIVLGGLSGQTETHNRAGLPVANLGDRREKTDDRRRLFVVVKIEELQ